MGSSWRMIRAYCGYGIVEHMSGDGRTALGWPPKPPRLATHRLVRPEVKSKFDFDINTKRWFGPIGSSWRSIRAYCGYGIVEHMSGDGQTALVWPPKPPWPYVAHRE